MTSACSPNDLASQQLGAYLDALAAAQPVPGGGAVAGVTLAQANALGSMVVGYALGKPKFAAHNATHHAAHAMFEQARREAITLANNDATAYGALNALWKLPKDDPARSGFADAVRAAIGAPESTLQLAHNTLCTLEVLVGTTSASLASDLAIAIDLALVASAAQANVRINLPSLSDETERALVSARTEAFLAASHTLALALRARMQP
jgi:formiminotetrahydrofolate cyclodeaminase